jgi:hypothetical protein
VTFGFAIAACLVAAIASLLRGRRYIHDEATGRVAGAPAQTSTPGPAARH